MPGCGGVLNVWFFVAWNIYDHTVTLIAPNPGGYFATFDERGSYILPLSLLYCSVPISSLSPGVLLEILFGGIN